MQFITLTETSVGIETAVTNEIVINKEQIRCFQTMQGKFRDHTQIYISDHVYINVTETLEQVRNLVVYGPSVYSKTDGE